MSLRKFFRLDDDHPFTGWHMLAVVTAFFGVIIAVNMVMAFSATRTFPGLIVKNSYVASQNYNDVLAGAREQTRTGWALESRSEAGYLTLRFTAPGGATAESLDVSVIAGRPSTTRYDRTLTMRPEADRYRAAEALPAGVWEIDVEVSRAGAPVYRERRRVVVSEGNS